MMKSDRKLVIAFTILAGCDPELETGDTPESFRDEHVDDDDVVVANDLEVVYELRRVRNAEGNVVERSEFGRLDLETWQKVAAPEAHLDDEFLYFEEAGAVPAASGEGMEHFYRVRRIPNSHPPVPKYDPVDLAKVLAPELAEELAKLDDDARLRVMLRLPNYPDAHLPLMPEVSAVSVADYLAAQEIREAAIEDRKVRFERLSADLVAAVEKSGGEIVDEFWLIGWLSADLSKDAIQSLSRSGLVSRMYSSKPAKSGGLTVGQMREREASDMETFWTNAYFGQDPDTGAAIHVGIQEVGSVEENACFWGEGTGCTQDRLLNLFDCTSSSCALVTPANYTHDDGPHGTAVSAMIAADYTEHQAGGFWICDTTTNHSTSWENAASGYATEAEVSYFDHRGPTVADDDDFAKSTECLMGIGTNCSEVDISNTSAYWTGSESCNAETTTLLEDAAETAFDDGIFVVYCAGNEGVNGWCSMGSPGDTPKVFAVNGLDVTSTAYATAPIDTSGDCLLGLDCASRGGVDVDSPNGVNQNDALSAIALAAPSNGIGYATYDGGSGNRGCVNTNFIPGGTSLAAPAVAGMAAVLKSYHLDVGDTWISNPGRVFAMMLAMGDRASEAGGMNTTGSDELFGMGRAKLRLLEDGAASSSPGGYSMELSTFSTTGQYVFNAFDDQPVEVGAKEVKCVMLGREDMSNKDDVSKINLEVRIRGKDGSGNCTEGQGTVYFQRTDSSYDTKKMVMFEDVYSNIEDRCVEVTLDRDSISTAGSISVNTFCMYTSEVDYEPN
jgi:hypothetical protein